jgi:hypothetical protein
MRSLARSSANGILERSLETDFDASTGGLGIRIWHQDLASRDGRPGAEPATGLVKCLKGSFLSHKWDTGTPLITHGAARAVAERPQQQSPLNVGIGGTSRSAPAQRKWRSGRHWLNRSRAELGRGREPRRCSRHHSRDEISAGHLERCPKAPAVLQRRAAGNSGLRPSRGGSNAHRREAEQL